MKYEKASLRSWDACNVLESIYYQRERGTITETELPAAIEQVYGYYLKGCPRWAHESAQCLQANLEREWQRVHAPITFGL